MSSQYDIGMVGLGVMGGNLARNMSNNGSRVLGYERTPVKAQKFNEEFGSDTLQATADFEEFVNALGIPKKFFLLVPAGKIVDDVIERLLPYLHSGDIIIDGGNSHWPDTVRREQELKEKGVMFFGCGVSGGEEGALNGPSMMPGGDKDSYQKYLVPILKPIAAKDFSGGSCVTWIGQDGAGHYVKMVHNGIEYAVMQMLAEVYDMLRNLYGYTPSAIADIFEKLHSGKLESFLTEISIGILRKEDDQGDGYLLDKILDKAGQKGTGKWTVLDAIERGVAVPSISEAVNARIVSSQKDLRIELQKHISPATSGEKISVDEFGTFLEDAVSAGMLSAYSQGYSLISTAAKEQNWDIDLSEISRIWQGGCIIRAVILKFLHETFQKSQQKDAHLLQLPEIAEEITKALPAMRKVVATGMNGGVPVPVLSSGLAYLENMRQAQGSANFIQGLRDFFGAHTFERNDREGVFHAEWNG